MSSKIEIPEEDEIWYVSIDNDIELKKVKVWRITEKIVTLQEPIYNIGAIDSWEKETQYKREDIEFVEKIK